MVVPECIDNIMGGLESTGGVTLHNHRRKLKQRFDIIAKLGQGTYGKVQLGVNKETGQEVAIKIIKKCKIKTEADLIRIRREIQIMSSMKHPYIIHIYEVFENRDKMVLVMEYSSGGELFDYLTKHRVLEESEARRIFRQIAMGVYYCHKHHICHRDLKLENILLDEHGNAKIADFGLTNVFDGKRLLNTFCGSPLYASPEIVKGVPYYGPEVDCWSLGVLLYTLVYGAMPFDGSNFKRLVRQISAGDYFEPANPSSASDLIRGLLTVDSKERFDITAVCRHPWMDEEGKVSCFRLAEQLAEEEPNRLDLLLALASPSQPQESAVAEEGASSAVPIRSQSLGSFSSIQPSATFTTVPTKPVSEETGQKKMSERKRERSSSRSRRKESSDDKMKRRSVASKSSDSELGPREEIEKVLEMAARVSDDISTTESTPSSLTISNDQSPDDQSKSSAQISSPVAPEAAKVSKVKSSSTKEKRVKKEKKKEVKSRDDKSVSSNESAPASPAVEAKKERSIVAEPTISSATPEIPAEQPTPPAVSLQQSNEENSAPSRLLNELSSTPVLPADAQEKPDAEKVRPEVTRRNSRVLETAELFSKSTSTDKLAQKKLFIPGVKVSDAKAAFERRLSASQSPPSETKPDFVLASTVNLNQLVMNELSKEEPTDASVQDEKADEILPDDVPISKDTDDERSKKEKAVKVISSAISEGGLDKKPSLPKRRLSRPLPITGSRDSVPKEVIIPIQIESREVASSQPTERLPERQPPMPCRKTSISSRASSSSLGRQDSNSSTISASSKAAPLEPIRKSPREVIIPIAVEGGGIVTPSESTLSKLSSASASLEDVPLRGFGLHSTRRRLTQQETADSISSDEDDADFEAISTENLFTTLLARMRNLTQRLDEGRAPFPSLFNSNFEPRRLMETKSFDTDAPLPWRRKSGTMHTASSTLPRGFTTKSLRRYRLRDDEAKTDISSANLPRAPPRRWYSQTTTSYLPNASNDGSRKTDYHKSKSESTGSCGPNVQIPNEQSNENSSERVRRLLMGEQFGKFESDDRMTQSGRSLGYHRGTHYYPHPFTNIVDYNSPVEPIYSAPSTSFQDASDFGKYIDFKRSLERDRALPRFNRPLIAHDKIKELHEYRRSVSEQWKARENAETEVKCGRNCDLEKNATDSFEESVRQLTESFKEPKEEIERLDRLDETKSSEPAAKSLQGPKRKIGRNLSLDLNAKDTTGESTGTVNPEEKIQPKKESRFLSKIRKNKAEESRVDRTIKALKKSSAAVENVFSESTLLKRAVSVDDINEASSSGRSARASSLKLEDQPSDKVFKKKESNKFKKGGVFETIRRVDKENDKPEGEKDGDGCLKKNTDETQTCNGSSGQLKKLEFNQNDASDISPTGDFDEANSQFSQTDNSDTWSSSDVTERYLDAGSSSSCLLALNEENISERIRRKSFYHRFNTPKRYSYQRSSSNMERKRHF